jgi:C-terminal processing protease CtpA/Prc
MTAWASIRRFAFAFAFIPTAFALTAPAAEPQPKQTPRAPRGNPTQLRELAERAEQTGDWETAFAAYCHLYSADRSAAELRDKLTAALRRAQQLRRHRDLNFQQFASGLSIGAALDLFAEVVQKLPGLFVDRDKATPQNLWVYAMEELDRALGSPNFVQAFLNHPEPENVAQFRITLRRDWAKRTIADQKDARTTLRNLIATAHDALNVRVAAAMVLECASGACSGLDEYTVFLTPSSESSGGPDLLRAAGLYCGAVKDGIAVHGIVPNSWFALSHPHIRRGFRVAKINGRTVETMEAAAEALRHPNPDGFHSIDFQPGAEGSLVGALIPVTVPTVYGHKLVNPPGTEKIGYARIGGFSPTTPRELDGVLETLKTDGARAIVLDLRGNHGGTFLSAVEVARRLLPTGLIVTTQGQAAEVDNQVFSSASGMAASGVPLVILIDGETASAAEVLAAALKDNGRAKLVGMPSFGKGTLQYPLRLMTLDAADPAGKKPGKAGTVRVTIARLTAPGGSPINGFGVTPDVLEANETLQRQVAIETALEELSRAMMMPSMSPMQPLPLEPNEP